MSDDEADRAAVVAAMRREADEIVRRLGEIGPPTDRESDD